MLDATYSYTRHTIMLYYILLIYYYYIIYYYTIVLYASNFFLVFGFHFVSNFSQMGGGTLSQFCAQSCKWDQAQDGAMLKKSFIIPSPSGHHCCLSPERLFHILPQINVNAGCQKFMLKSLGRVQTQRPQKRMEFGVPCGRM